MHLRWIGMFLFVLVIVGLFDYGSCQINKNGRNRIRRSANPQISVPGIPPLPQFNQVDMILKAAQEAWKIIQQLPRTA